MEILAKGIGNFKNQDETEYKYRKQELSDPHEIDSLIVERCLHVVKSCFVPPPTQTGASNEIRG